MLKLDQRSYVVYFPRVKLYQGEVVQLGDYELISLKNVFNIEDYLSNDLILEDGCLLKFKEKYIFDLEEDINIFYFTESLRFCYFSNNIPARVTPINNFIVYEAFSPYTIINKNTDSSFEPKLILSNGFFKKYVKRDDVILSKIKNVEYLIADKFFFRNYNEKLYIRFINELYLYNQITKVNDLYDFHNKTLFARLSIESAIKILGLEKKQYVDQFNNKIDKYIISSDIKSDYKEIFDFYNIEIRNNLKKILDKIGSYLININEIRQKLAHEGEEDREGRFLIFFAIWFELFLELCSSEEIKTFYAVKLVFFLWLMNFELEKWDEMKFGNSCNMKKTYLYQFCEILRVYEPYKKNEILKIYLDTMARQLIGLSVD